LQNNAAGSPPYVDTTYHQFTCSKCHSPHAGRLPRLMRTNCLDNGSDASNFKEANTDYDQRYWMQGLPTGSHTPNGNIANDIRKPRADSNAPYNDGQDSLRPGPNLMNLEAPNCHSTAGSTSGGWNRLTPWVDTQPQ